MRIMKIILKLKDILIKIIFMGIMKLMKMKSLIKIKKMEDLVVIKEDFKVKEIMIIIMLMILHQKDILIKNKYIQI